MGFPFVIIVDDGSGPESYTLFEALASQPHVCVVRHAVNCGKGSALKTGMMHAAARFPEAPGVICMDGDGSTCRRMLTTLHVPLSTIRTRSYWASEDSPEYPLEEFHR